MLRRATSLLAVVALAACASARPDPPTPGPTPDRTPRPEPTPTPDPELVEPGEALSLARAWPRSPGTVRRLVWTLEQATDLEARRAAASALGECGLDAPPAVPALTAALDDPALAPQAATALGRLGRHAVPAVPRLGALLGSPDDVAVAAAVRALARLDVDDVPVEPVVALLARPVEGLPAWERWPLLSRLGPRAAARATPTLLAIARDDEPDDAQVALGALLTLSPDQAPTALAIARDRLVRDGLREAVCAASTIARVGTAGAVAVDELVAQARAGRMDGRSLGVALAGVGAVAAVLELAAAPEARLRAGSAVALGLLPPTPERVSTLGALLADEEGSVVEAALEAAGTCGPAALSLEPALVEALRRSEAGPTVCLALGSVGCRGEAALELLETIAREPDSRASPWAALGLAQLGATERAVAALTALAAGESDEVAALAIGLLALLGPEAAPAATTLVARLADDGPLRPLACDALAAIGTAAAPAATAALEELLGEEGPAQASALRALAHVVPDQARVVALLRPRLLEGEADQELRVTAALELALLGEERPRALAVLAEAFARRVLPPGPRAPLAALVEALRPSPALVAEVEDCVRYWDGPPLWAAVAEELRR